MIAWGRYDGIPFRDGGRDLDGCDCWGWARVVYREELGVELPVAEDYHTALARDSVSRAVFAGLGEWREIDLQNAREGDAVLMWDAAPEFPCHVALFAPPRSLWHMTPLGVERVEFNDGTRLGAFRARRIKGIYRHRGLA